MPENPPSDEPPDIRVLAPRHNPELLGHASAEQTLLGCWTAGRMPHAWLIGGPAGIGKATLAYRIARFVLAQSSAEASLFAGPAESLYVAPEAGTFARVASGGHSDCMTLERGRDPKTGRTRTGIAVDDVRRAIDFIRLTPAESTWKVLIVDAADELTTASANALLKVLEEPPDNALFLLVSHAPGRLLPTIRSRCQRLDLAPLQPDVVISLLTQRCPGLSPEDANAAAVLSEGSVGRALDLVGVGGLGLYREIVQLVGGLPKLDAMAAHRLADRLGGRNEEQGFQTFRTLMDWWLKRFISGLASGRRPEPVIPEESKVFQSLAAHDDLDHWLQVWDKVFGLLGRAGAPDHLDRRQLVLGAFLTLESATQSG